MSWIELAEDAAPVAGRALLGDARVVSLLTEASPDLVPLVERMSASGARGALEVSQTAAPKLDLVERFSGQLHLPNGEERLVASNFAGSGSQEYVTNVQLAAVRKPGIAQAGGRAIMTTVTFDDTTALGRGYLNNVNKTATVVRMNAARTSYSAGTAMTVRADGMIVGSLHSVAQPGIDGDILVKLPSAPAFTGSIVASDAAHDLVLIKPARPIAGPVQFNHPNTFAARVSPGERLFALATPDAAVSVAPPNLNAEVHLTQGAVIAENDVGFMQGPKMPMYRTKIPGLMGMSGGPAYSERTGEYVGALQGFYDPALRPVYMPGPKDEWSVATPARFVKDFVLRYYHRP